MNDQTEFLPGMSAAAYIEEYISSFRGPFSKRGAGSEAFLTKLARGFFAAVENLIGAPLYVKKNLPSFDGVPSKFNKLILDLSARGILKNIYLPRSMPGWPAIASIALKAENGTVAYGSGLDYTTAATKAFAELLERHSLLSYRQKENVFGTWLELGRYGAIDPRIFACFSENQLSRPEYARHTIKENSKFSWATCKSFLSGKKRLIPAQLIHGKWRPEANEPQIREANSNGAAAGVTWENAAYNAIMETIERDSLMIHWLNTISPPKINIRHLKTLNNRAINQLLEKYQKYDIDFAVLDITTDIGVPVFMTAIRDTAPARPLVYLAPRADFDIEKCIAESLIDGLRAGYLEEGHPEQIQKANLKSPDIENINERKDYWCDKSGRPAFDFIFAGREEKIGVNEFPRSDSKSKLRKLKEILRGEKYDAYLADITSSIASEYGLTVIKSIMPDFYPLYLNEHFKYLGSKRLYETPVRMGVWDIPKKEVDLNSVPHPFL